MRYIMILLILTFLSCSVEPVPIEYNNDECSFCKMKISDIRFGAEMVTTKGKIYKFDSAECMIRTYLENDDRQYAFKIVTDYSRPHHLIDAESASFLISEGIPSPMGANLSAYEDKKIALQMQEANGGKMLDFAGLTLEFQNR